MGKRGGWGDETWVGLWNALETLVRVWGLGRVFCPKNNIARVVFLQIFYWLKRREMLNTLNQLNVWGEMSSKRAKHLTYLTFPGF